MSLEGLEQAKRNWEGQRVYYERELSITSNPAQKLELRKRIEECQEKIKEIEAELKSLEQDSESPVVQLQPQSAPYIKTVQRPPVELPEPDRQNSLSRRILSTAILSMVVTILVMWVRSLEIFQVCEWKAYDQLLRLRPDEGLDPRLLVVEATETDIQKYGGFPLPDATLAQVIDRLEQHQPRVIGLDIFRPVEDGHAELISHFHNNNHLIAICAAKEAHNPDKSSYSPPSGLPEKRLGFSDAVNDDDAIRRRHLLFLQPDKDDRCATAFSFSARIALHYLKEAKEIEAQTLSKDEVQIGEIIFKRLQTDTGAYKNLDNRGFQIMLNYRASGDVAQRVSFSQVLKGEVASESVKNKIILIGVTGQSSGDFVFTPYSANQRPYQPMPGVLVQAHSISQILSAVLDRRPLLWVWSQWGEASWIFGWSLVGGIIAWRCWGILYFAVATGAAIIVLDLVCFGILTYGGWVPLVPSALALVATSGGAITLQRFPNCQQP